MIEQSDLELIHQIAAEEARDAIASLSGLVLKRIQEETPTRLAEHNIAESVVHEELAKIFGEALQQFSANDS